MFNKKQKSKVKKVEKVEKPGVSLVDEILNSTSPETKIKDNVEPIPEVLTEAPPVTAIPVVDPEPYPDQQGVRFYNNSLAGKSGQGSVGHDLLFKVKFDEHGISEFVTDQRVIDKLLKVGWKIFKA